VTSLQLQGADALRGQLGAAGDDLDDLSATNRIVAQQLLASAIPRVPIATGHLVGSLRATSTATTATVETLVPYAHPVHGGVPAKHIRPRPFLYDALDATTDQVLDTYEQAVDAALEKVGA
jgi:hypothetical protein